MYMNDNASVNETPVSGDSQTPVETTNVDNAQVETTPSSESVEQSGENINKDNTQGNIEELTASAVAQVKDPKSINHVQTLARRAKEAEERLKQFESVETQLRQPQIDASTRTEARTLLMEQRQRELEKQLQEAEAKRIYPELDRTSDKYDPEFDDLVYNMELGSNMSTVEAAKAVKKYISKYESKVANETQQNILQKTVQTSQINDKRSQNVGGNASAKQEALAKFKRTGSLDDLVAYQSL